MAATSSLRVLEVLADGEFRTDRYLDLIAGGRPMQIARLSGHGEGGGFEDQGALGWWRQNTQLGASGKSLGFMKYVIDPWRALDVRFDLTRPRGHWVAQVFLWIARVLRYTSSTRSWTPLFGKVWWTSVFGKDHTSDLEQSASWVSGDLYTTIFRSGDARFADTEGSHGDKAGAYSDPENDTRIVEGDLLRFQRWENSRWATVHRGLPGMFQSLAAGPPTGPGRACRRALRTSLRAAPAGASRPSPRSRRGRSRRTSPRRTIASPRRSPPRPPR